MKKQGFLFKKNSSYTMKIIALLFGLFIFQINVGFSQTPDDLQNQLQEKMQQMLEQFQKNFDENSFFQIDTMVMDGFGGDFEMPLDGNSFFFIDSLNMDDFGNGDFGEMPFSSEGFGMDLQKLMEEMQRGFQQMDPEDLERLGKMFEGFQFGQPYFLNPDDLENLKNQSPPPADSQRKRRNTIK